MSKIVYKGNSGQTFTVDVLDFAGASLVTGGALVEVSSTGVYHYTLPTNISGDIIIQVKIGATVKATHTINVNDQLQDIHDAVNGKDLAQVSDVEATYVIPQFYFRFNISNDFVTGGIHQRKFLRVSGLTGAFSNVNGDYKYWGERSFTSNFSSSVVDAYPMYTNGTYAIYCVTDSPSSGFTATESTSDDYQWQICRADRYSQLVDETLTSINSTSREYLSIQTVIYTTGTAGNWIFTTGTIMDTSSSYGSTNDGDDNTGGTIQTVTIDVPANYTIDITDHINDRVVEITGNLGAGLNREQTLQTINDEVISSVNADGIVNHSIDWKLGDDNYINTNQPVNALYGYHITIDNTDGTGTASGVSTKTVNNTVPTNVNVSGLTDEQSNKLDAIDTRTTGIKTKTDQMTYNNRRLKSVDIDDEQPGRVFFPR